jgi:hypothetical protein
MVKSQGSLCAICELPPRGKGRETKLHVDHDHTTKAVRGLLCFRCNLHLAWMELFEAPAKAYLLRASMNTSPKYGAGFVRPKQAKRALYAEDRPDTITAKKSYSRLDAKPVVQSEGSNSSKLAKTASVKDASTRKQHRPKQMAA